MMAIIVLEIVMVMILIMIIMVVMEIVIMTVDLDDGGDAVSGGCGLCDDNKNDNISYIRSGVHFLFDVLPS